MKNALILILCVIFSSALKLKVTMKGKTDCSTYEICRLACFSLFGNHERPRTGEENYDNRNTNECCHYTDDCPGGEGCKNNTDCDDVWNETEGYSGKCFREWFGWC